MPEQSKRQGQNENEALGLLANGSAGDWEISVDETTREPDRWFVQLQGPSVYFSFEIPSPEMISQALDFLGVRSPSSSSKTRVSAENDSLVLGQHRQAPVILVRDDEYEERYFLVIGQMADPVVRFMIAGQDWKDIQEALRQASGDLEDEG